MRKCNECPLKEARLICLKCEQEADEAHRIVLPQIIKPTVKNVPLEELSDREKSVVLLHTIGEMTYYRIAIVFGISHHTAKSIILRAFNKLRRRKDA